MPAETSKTVDCSAMVAALMSCCSCLSSVAVAPVKLNPHLLAAGGEYETLADAIALSPEVAFERDKDGTTTLMTAVVHGQAKCAKLLISKGVRVDARDNFGFTALMWASGQGFIECVRLLLAHGADVNAENESGRNAIGYAREGGHDDIVRLLNAQPVPEKHKDDGKMVMVSADGNHIIKN